MPTPQGAALQSRLQAGFDALAAGDWQRAGAICNEVLAAAPKLARAHFLAARIAVHRGDRSTAIKAFETTVRLNDRHAAAWANLAWLYASEGRLRRADASLRNAALTDRGHPATRDLIGRVFRLVGNLEASLDWHRKAVEVDGSHVPFLVNYANACIYTGDIDAALEALDRSVALEPANTQVHWLLARTRRAESASHIESMQALLEREDDARNIAYLNYAIGKEHEDLDQPDEAFAAWSRGATARRQTVAWDERADEELFDVLQATFTPEWLAGQSSDCFDATPIFIVGLPRTGSTLLDRMLDAHPVVSSAGELRHFGFAVRRITGHHEPRQFTAALIRAAASADSGAIGEAYVESIAPLKGEAVHVIDKLPSNFIYLPLILAALPNARVLHVRRDPADTCLAIFKQLFADAYLYSYDLEELARYYVRYHGLMATWRERFPQRFIDVDYESLVTDTEDTLRPVLQYIGLSWNRDCLDYFKGAARSSTASAVQVQEAPHSRSVGRWKRHEQALRPALEILAAAGIA
jgi:tetratricopeptide (TPR) repeat protein